MDSNDKTATEQPLQLSDNLGRNSTGSIDHPANRFGGSSHRTQSLKSRRAAARHM